MANTTITDLPNATTPLGPEYIVLDQGGETKRLQLSDLFQTSGSETITSLTQNGNVLSYTNEAGVVNTIDVLEEETPETLTSLSLLNGVLSYTDEASAVTSLNVIQDETLTSLSLLNGVLSYTDEDSAVTSLNVIQDETVTSLSLLNGQLTYTDEASADTVLNVIEDDTVTASKLKLTATPADGNFLIYDAATDGFQPTASTAQAHDLFSANHTDVDSNVTPSYGDSMYYNGTEWTTGNFGNYGADMEYMPITRCSGGVTHTLQDTRPSVSVDVQNSYYILSTSLNSIGAIGLDTDDMDTQTPNGNGVEVSGNITFPIANFVGEGLKPDNIRGIYIKVFAYWAIGTSGQKAKITAIYPDGTERAIIASPEDFTTAVLGTTAAYDQASEQVFLVPVNEGQQDFVIGLDIDDNDSNHERIKYEIIGAQCTKRVALSPDLDVIHISGSQDSDQKAQGYVDADTNHFDYLSGGDTNSGIWTSEDPETTTATTWAHVFPITVPDNVSKTIIRGTNNWVYSSSADSEEIDIFTITIDWNAGTINGVLNTNYNLSNYGYINSNDLVGEKTFTMLEDDAISCVAKFQIIGRDIVKLPCPYHGSTYSNMGQTYTIENYKTTAANIIDDIANDSSTSSIATSESIKAYVDEYAMKYSGVTGTGLETSGFSTYRDLDLSATVGANRTLVIMEVHTGTVPLNLFFRTKGSAVKPYGGANQAGYGSSGGVTGSAGDGFTCIINTNENGVLEYTGNTTSTGIEYTVQAYQKLA